MIDRKDEKWLDDQLRRAVDGTTPVFDAGAWKQKYAEPYQVLLSRNGQSGRPAPGWRLVLRCSIGKLAVAAALVVAVGVFLPRSGRGPRGLLVKSPPALESPARMLSMMSLRIAYETGGFEALDRQLQNALDEFGPRSPSVSMQEFFERVNGS